MQRIITKWLGPLSIKRKLILVTMISSGIALFAACLTFISIELIQYRRTLLREVAILTQIIGNNSTAALIFNDEESANEILSALVYEKNVIFVGLYTSNRLFAAYARDEHIGPPPFLEREQNGHWDEGAGLNMIRPVTFHDEEIGRIFLQYDLSVITNRLVQYAVIVFGVFLVAAAIALFITQKLQRTISGPILHLSQIANRVSDKKDYSVRAEKGYNDELGQLIDRFNEMLFQIQERDRTLVQYQEELENRVLERTEALQQEILERERAEKEKEGIQAQLLHAQKMEAVGILAGGIAHDFNNLLTGIQGCTEMVMLENEISDPVFDDLRQIQMAVERAADLTRQLLLFSRKQPMAFTSLDFNKVLEDLIKMLHRLIGEDISINTHYERRLWPIRADQGTLQQVVMNLTVNARDAMPQGGTFTISTKNIILDEESCTMPNARPGRFIRISFEDTGAGMDEETLKRIFEPFYTTKGLGKGTGLGLSVVYGIVQEHEGWVEVTSQPGKGSRFDVFLPALDSRSEYTIRTRQTRLNLFHGNGERILVVEDEKNVRDFLARAMTRYGYDVTLASSVKEALMIYKKEEGRFDLLFSDVVLPDGNGVYLVDSIASHNPDIRVILCSGYTDHKSQWPLIQERGYLFLSKPFVLATLLEALSETFKSK
ncbi:MAG TPA: response regulator [bacterium]|nr:response regulator [bacterium]